jgi:hypothetical protein
MGYLAYFLIYSAPRCGMKTNKRIKNYAYICK